MSDGSSKHLQVERGAGFSLIEVMAAMAAGLIVLAAALQALVFFQREFVRQHERIVQQQDVRLGLDLLQQELRMTAPESLSIVSPETVEFLANVGGLMTNVAAPVGAGQTAATVQDGRGWPEHKLVSVCWNDVCLRFTLARAGQRNLLTFVEAVPQPIPSGALVMVMNRVRYYSRPDEHGVLRWLRQVDGGASVVASNIAAFTLRYVDAQGHPTTQPLSVRLLLVEITLPGRTVKERREISLGV